MTDRERLIAILSKPIYPREGADKAEVVADYLLDQGVSPVVRCKDCKHRGSDDCVMHIEGTEPNEEFLRKVDNDFCSYGDMRERRTDGAEID